MRFHDFNFFDGSKEALIAKDNVITKPYDGNKLYNVKPASSTIDFTNSDSTNVVWNEGHTAATFTHSMNCYPVVQVYNGSREQVYPTITIVDGNSFILNFNAANPVDEGETWKCTVMYGAEYGVTGEIHSDASSVLETAQEYVDQTKALHDDVLTVINIPVGHAYNISVYQQNGIAHIQWTDALDNINEQGATIAYWGKTRLMMKIGGYPENENDGVVLVDNTVRNAYRDTSFDYVLPEEQDIRFALFSCSTGGVWNTSSTAPRFNFNFVSFASVRQILRSGLPLSTIGLHVGDVIDVQTSSRFPSLRWMLVDEDYQGCRLYDNTILTKKAIFIPQYLISEADTSNALLMQFDASESQYGRTDDIVFASSKIYYKFDTGAYVQLVENTDYAAGDNIVLWETTMGYNVFTKNDTSRKSYGSNRWKESNMRQWLNATGSGWFTKQNIYDVLSTNAGYGTGFKSAFYPEFLEVVQPVYNTVARNTIAEATGGAGGGFEETIDTFWLPSMMEIFGIAVNGYHEGVQFDYFKNIATTAQLRIQRDMGGVARIVWLRSPFTGHTYYEYGIGTSGSSSFNTAYNTCALLPAVCIA